MGAPIRAAGLLDGMLQWLLQQIAQAAPARGGVRPRDLAASEVEPEPPLDECGTVGPPPGICYAVLRP